MSYQSDLRGYEVITKANEHKYIRLARQQSGSDKPSYTGRPYDQVPFGQTGYAKPFKLKVIDRAEWPERIKDLEKEKARLSDLIRFKKVPCLNQEQTNYCWCNGVIHAVYFARLLAGLKHIDLSPASVAAKIKNFRNVGGWGGEAIKGIQQFGIVPQSLWPANAIDRRYDTAESRAAAKEHGVYEFDEIRPRSFDELMTCLLLRIPVPAGHNWWGHLICHVDPIMVGRGAFGTRFRNSWSEDWEDEGFGLMDEEKATPDEANGVRVAA